MVRIHAGKDYRVGGKIWPAILLTPLGSISERMNVQTHASLRGGEARKELRNRLFIRLPGLIEPFAMAASRQDNDFL